MTGATRRPTVAGRAALALFADAPWSVRAHVLLRWWSAPFPAAAEALPASGRMLEIGCGHGLFAGYAALSEPGRTVVGVDIDAGKIACARAAARQLDRGPDEGRLTFDRAESGAVPPGPWDGIAVIDMLYLLPRAQQRVLLSEAIAELAPGGVLVIKEMGTVPRWKVRLNTWQETISVRLLHLTAGSAFDFVDPATMAGWLEERGLTTMLARLDRGRLHPHHLLVGTRTA